MAHPLDDTPRTRDVILDENVTFEFLFLNQTILKGLKESGYRKPSPIQLRAIPIGRCGFDLIVKSKSGTGKTLVFSIIALESVNLEKYAVQVLILVPAREIAVQIQDVLKTIGKYFEGLQVESFIGGLPLSTDKEKCQACHIAVGTPGRIKQLIKEKHLKPDSISLFILDEADKLMESSFQNDINEIYNMLPDKKQLITTSATYPNELNTFLSNYMLSPTEVTVEIESPLLLGLKHFVSIVKCHPNVVQQTKIKNEALLKILSHVRFTQCLVFSNYQTRAESLSNMLIKHDWNATFISAAQSQSERLQAINDLKEFKCRILLSTDLTSRGIDASNVNLVINYDIPFEPMTYLHRMGRAGRYGSLGICINLASEGTELKLLQTVLGVIGGSNMSIPKLPKLTTELDLHKVVICDPDQVVFGKPPEENSSDQIKDGVLQLKVQVKEDKKQTKTVKNKEPPLGEERTVKEDQDEDTMCILKALAKENLKDDSVTSGTSSLKENEDRYTMSILKALSEGNIKDDSVSLFIEESVHRDELNSIGTKSLLESMASGNYIASSLPESSDSSIVKSDDLQNLMISADNKKRKIIDKVSCSASTADLKKNKKQNNQNPVYFKNLALFYLAKIVSNCGDVHSSAGPLEKYLEMLKDEEKTVTIDDVKDAKLVLEDLRDCQLDPKKNLNTEEDQKVVVGEDTYLENIFLTTYKSFIESDSNNWKSFVPKEEIEKFEQQLVSSVDSEKYDDIDQEYEDYYEEDYDMDEENYEHGYEEQVVKDDKQDENSDEHSGGNYNFMKWVPVEKSENKVSKVETQPQQACLQNTDDKVVEKYEHFQNYYDQCSDTLWQNGLSFENVPDFDDWFFYEWQAQVSAVRNYVQQNVYVQEMSKLQGQQKQRKVDK